MHTFWHTLENEDRVIHVEVTYRVHPYFAATRTNPAEGGDVELESTLVDGNEWTGTAAEEAELYEAAMARSGEDELDAAADYGDYLYDMRRDAEL